MEAIDWDALKENCAGDDDLVAEIVDLFRRECGAMLDDVRQAGGSKDALAVKKSAHRLRGALVSLAANGAAEIAGTLEKMGAENNMTAVDSMVESLNAEMSRLLAALEVKRAA